MPEQTSIVNGDLERPAHPGRLIRELLLEPQGLSVSAAAQLLGVSRPYLSQLLGGHYGVGVDLALRLAELSGRPAELWLLLQMEYDLARARARAGG